MSIGGEAQIAYKCRYCGASDCQRCYKMTQGRVLEMVTALEHELVKPDDSDVSGINNHLRAGWGLRDALNEYFAGGCQIKYKKLEGGTWYGAAPEMRKAVPVFGELKPTSLPSMEERAATVVRSFQQRYGCLIASKELIEWIANDYYELVHECADAACPANTPDDAVVIGPRKRILSLANATPKWCPHIELTGAGWWYIREHPSKPYRESDEIRDRDKFCRVCGKQKPSQ